jgi:DDE superfamily endonuclease
MDPVMPAAHSVARKAETWPTTLAYLPAHASWLNQIEMGVSVIQRKALRHADFADLNELAK